MRKPMLPKISKWPFFAGDAVLAICAVIFYHQSALPLTNYEILGCVVCVAIGALLAVLPFVLEYRAAVRLAEAEGLTSVVAQVQKVEQIAAQIGYATNQWQVVRESADKTADAAREISRGIADEVKSFGEFVQRSNEGEKAALRLEVEKLHRAEMEWLQVIVRMLDHIYALNQAAAQSRQPGVAEQIGKFQNACLDAVRRIGLMPFIAAPAEKFDEQRHQSIDAEKKPAAGEPIEATVASGYTFQGRLLRPAIVRLQNGNGNGNGNGAAHAGDGAADSGQSQLPLAQG
jgi:molecular chaperone GrpE (heat shock protein)